MLYNRGSWRMYNRGIREANCLIENSLWEDSWIQCVWIKYIRGSTMAFLLARTEKKDDENSQKFIMVACIIRCWVWRQTDNLLIIY